MLLKAGTVGSVEPERSIKKRMGAEFFLIAGALIMAASLIGALSHYAIHRQRVRETRRAISALLNAGARFRLEYGRWPGIQEGRAVDVRFGMGRSPNRQFVALLSGRPAALRGEGYVNARGIVFWDPPEWRPGTAGVNEYGDLLDPWGTPFQIVVDGDLNGICEIERSVYGSVEAGMLIWSCGPDRRSDTEDDIRSW
jgi:type II secretory pathway pseudopilin PulG